MIRLLLVRHGETAWNATGLYQGQEDVPLNEVGRRQAEVVAERLRDERFHIIYASDLSRARATADIVARFHRLPVRLDVRLRELNFGEWQGLSYREIEERDGERLAAWNADRVHCAAPGGESLAQMGQRARMFLNDVRAAHQGQTVAVVSHGGIIRIILCVLIGHPLDVYWQFAVGNTSVSEIELHDRGAVVALWNDRHHLEEAHRQGVL